MWRTGFDAVVVGRGVVGAAVAFALGRESLRVLCVGPADGPSATAAAGAMLGVLGETVAPDSDRPLPGTHPSVDLTLRLAAIRRYPGWLEEIRGQGVEAPSPKLGTFVVAGERHQGDLAAADAIESAASRHGIPCERVGADDVPGLRLGCTEDPARVLSLPHEGFVDPTALTRSLFEAAERTGHVTVLDSSVERVVSRGARVEGVVTAGGESVAAERVVLSAGCGIPAIATASTSIAGFVPALVAAKGVSLLVEPPASRAAELTHTIRTPNREFACGLHLVPRDDHLLLGATNRVSRYPEVVGTATEEEVAWLRSSAVAELASDLGGWPLAAVLHGLRPLARDGLPIVGDTKLQGLAVATATYRNGVLLAPLLADIVAGRRTTLAPEVVELLSPRERSGMRASEDAAARVLEAGLAELAVLADDPYDSIWSGLLGRLPPGVLDRLSSGRAQGGDLYPRTIATLRDFPLVEMVPEAVVELAQAVGAVDA